MKSKRFDIDNLPTGKYTKFCGGVLSFQQSGSSEKLWFIDDEHGKIANIYAKGKLFPYSMKTLLYPSDFNKCWINNSETWGYDRNVMFKILDAYSDVEEDDDVRYIYICEIVEIY
jgi:hypothetical protein